MASHAELALVEPLAGEETLAEEMEKKLARERMIGRLRELWAERAFLFRAAVAGLLISTLMAFLIPKRYTSSTRLMPPDNQSSSGLALTAAALASRGDGLGGIAGNLLGLKNTSDLFVGILGSRTVQEELVEQFDLKKVYGDRSMEDTRQQLAAQTEISVDRKSQIMTIEVTDGSPQRAAAMAQAYVEELNRLSAELSTSSARRERIFLEGRLQTAGEDLETAERDFSQFASKNQTIDLQEQGKAIVESAANLQGQLIAAQSELEGLRQIYTNENVRVRSVQARISELKSQLEKMGGKAEDTPSGNGSAGDSLYPSIRKLPLLGVMYADLYRRSKVQEAVYETLTQEYEMAKLEEVKEVPVVKVLDAAEIPERKSYPPRLMIMLTGMIAAFSMCAAWVLGRAVWKRTDPSDLRKALAQEVFGAVKAAIPWVPQNGFHLHINGNGRAIKLDAGEAQKESNEKAE